MYSLLVLLLFHCIYAVECLTSSVKIKQCICDEIMPCKEGYLESVIPCADKCRVSEDYALTLSADYPSLRDCFLSYQESIKETIECTLNHLQDACTEIPGTFVEKRYSGTLKTAILSEIHSLASNAGVEGELKSILVVGKRFMHCLRMCIDNKTGHCIQKAKCGLKLPSDTSLVALAKNCALQSGINTVALQKICQCAVSAGIFMTTGA
uniref:Chondroitin proteoglycan 4 domain-containing protein n=1 Tax=Syphacia muris TaxID=451379 RepID=A0A0N5B088_9BILA